MTAKASYHFAGKTILITGGAGELVGLPHSVLPQMVQV